VGSCERASARERVQARESPADFVWRTLRRQNLPASRRQRRKSDESLALSTGPPPRLCLVYLGTLFTDVVLEAKLNRDLRSAILGSAGGRLHSRAFLPAPEFRTSARNSKGLPRNNDFFRTRARARERKEEKSSSSGL